VKLKHITYNIIYHHQLKPIIHFKNQMLQLSWLTVGLLASVPKVNCSIMIWSKSVEPTRNGFSWNN